MPTLELKNVQLTAELDAGSILEQLGLTRNEITRNVLRLSGGQQQADVVLEIKRGQLKEREMQ